LVVSDKSVRAARYHQETVESFLELLGACGFDNPHDLRPWNVQRRVSSSEIRHYGELYTYVERGDLLNGRVPAEWQHLWNHADPESFRPLGADSSSVMPPPPISIRSPRVTPFA
jgi:hypothetical protein